MPNRWVDGQDTATGGKFFVWKFPDRWETVMPAEKAVDFDDYPVELRYVVALQPSRLKKIENLLERGCGVGVRCRRQVGFDAAPAVRRLSVLHEGLMYPWVERLLLRERAPLMDERMRNMAAERGWDPESDIRTLSGAGESYRHFALIHAPDARPSADDDAFLNELNKDLRQMSARGLLGVTTHAAGPRPEPTLWTLAAAIFVLGPMLHVLGWFAPTFSIVLGATTLSLGWEVWRVYESHRSGAAAWQIKRNLMRSLPGLMLALGFGLLASSVMGMSPLAGWSCLGLAVTGVHWSRMFRALAVQRELYERLAVSGKLEIGQKSQWLKHAFSSSIGVWSASAVATVAIAALIGLAAPGIFTNGWALAALAAAPWALYDVATLARVFGSDWLFRRRLAKLLKRSVLLVA